MKNKRKTRMTKQRREILKVLKSTDSHPTADWIYDQVKKEVPNISLGTIYRNLNILTEMNKIMTLDYGSTYSRYDGNPDNHYHFKCENCGNVFDIDIDINQKINQEVNKNTEFKVFSHRTEFYGLCSSCQKKS